MRETNCKRRLTGLLVSAMIVSQIQVTGMAAPMTTEKIFNDVKENVWYSDAIQKWSQNGIITGYEDHSFKPHQAVTRAELATIIDRIFGLKDITYAKNYTDIKGDEWYYEAVSHVSSAGIINDADEKFNPNQSATREELAYALARAYKLTGVQTKTFKDQESISDWAVEAVDALVQNGYIVGMPDGRFAPKAPLTRSEMLVVIDRLTSTMIQEAGTYTTNIEGNLVVNTKDVTLKDMTISGNLYLAQGIGSGDITLDHITVKGTVFVEGGGENSIKCNDIDLLNPIDIQVVKPVRIVNTGKKIATQLQSNSVVTLEGSFSEITVPYNVTLKLGSSLRVDQLVTLSQATQDQESKMATIQMEKGAIIELLVADGATNVIGQGEIKQLNENIAGIKTEIKPSKVVTATGIQSNIVTKPETKPQVDSEDSEVRPEEKPETKPEEKPDVAPEEKPEIKPEEKPDVTPEEKPEEESPDHSVDENKWQLAWSDEFDGNQVDSSKWDYNNGFLDLNQEKQVYKSENASVKNGLLTITAKKEDTTIAGTTHQYSSARMVTKGKYAQKYGKIEVRAKLPLGKSLWPAIWMLPENDEYTGWPTSGEIDIMESRGSVPNQVWGTLHYGEKTPNNSQSGSSYTFPEGKGIDGFHTYGIEWQPGEIRWYVDGELYQTQDSWFTVDPDTGERYAFPAPFDKEFHVILNLALGGWYDGVGTNLEVDSSIFEGGKEHEMQVDYVRFYESKEEYPEASDPDSKIPELPEDARKPLSDGNLIYDNNYATYGIKDNPEGNISYGEGWNLLYKDSFGGKADTMIESLNGIPFAKIQIQKPGNEDYSIQLIQQTSLGRGRTYKLSFDVKSEGDRTIQFKVGGDEARGYAVYSDTYKEKVNSQVQHIEKTFIMKGNTDTAARLEFNVGLDSKDVWIGNVKLEEVESEPVVEDFNTPKAPLKNGSLVYNGAFDKGKLDRLTYWNLQSLVSGAATMNVPESTRDLHIQVGEGGSQLKDVTLDQRGLKLGKDASYTVTFTAKADKAQKMNVKLVGEEGQTIYSEHTIDLTDTKQKYEFILNSKGEATDKGRLVFEIGGVDHTEIVLDDVSLVETRQDFSDVNIFPLKNGDFSKGESGWTKVFGGSGAAQVTFDQEAKFKINDIGSDLWHVMLAQMNIPFSAGVKYIISFEASSDIERDMIVRLEQENTWRQFFEETVSLKPGKQTYSFEVTMPADGNVDLGLKFLMGTTPKASKETHTVTIDNVVCEVKDGVLLKSQLKNGQFNNGTDYWGTYVATDAGAKAEIKELDGSLQMDIESLGQNPWEIQLSQKGIHLEKGKTYEVGFKAHSEDATKLKVSVGHEAEDYSYTNYLEKDQFFAITQENNSHSFRFTMNNDTDENAKLALEAGQQEGAVPTTITLDDIYVTEVPSEEKEEVEETPVTITNLLQNGDFKNTDINNMGEFKWNKYAVSPGEATFTYNEGVQVDIQNSGTEAWQVTLEQGGLTLEEEKTYIVKFDASITTSSSLRVALQDGEGNEYIGKYAPVMNLKEGRNTYEYEFTVARTTPSNLTLKFQMGYDEWSGGVYQKGQNQIIIHNVALYEKPVEESTELVVTLDDFVLVEKDTTDNLLQDGGCSAQGAWGVGGPYVTFDFSTGAASAVITDEGKDPWDVIMYQPGITLEKGKTYTLSFKGEASRNKKIKMLTANKSYAEYFTKAFNLTNEVQAFTYDFTIGLDTSSELEFKIFMGAGI